MRNDLQEIGGVRLCDEALKDLTVKIKEFSTRKTDLEQLLYVLVEEYGYVLDALENMTKVSIVNVAIDDVRPGNMEYHSKLNKHSCPYYSKDEEYELPVAVCIRSGEKYRLIDGYHRYGTAKQDKRKKIDIVLIHGETSVKGETIVVFD